MEPTTTTKIETETERVKDELTRAIRIHTRALERVDSMPEETELQRVRKLRHVRELLVQAMIVTDGVTSLILLLGGVDCTTLGTLERLSTLKEPRVSESEQRAIVEDLGREPA